MHEFPSYSTSQLFFKGHDPFILIVALTVFPAPRGKICFKWRKCISQVCWKNWRDLPKMTSLTPNRGFFCETRRTGYKTIQLKRHKDLKNRYAILVTRKSVDDTEELGLVINRHINVQACPVWEKKDELSVMDKSGIPLFFFLAYLCYSHVLCRTWTSLTKQDQWVSSQAF